MAYQKLQASRAVAVTPSDTTDIPNPANGPNTGCVLYIGNGGNVRVLTAGGDDVVFVGVASGTFLPVNVLRVFSTNTGASQIIALW